MKARPVALAALAALSMCLIGCGFFAYTADLTGQVAQPATPMIAKPIPQTLYVIMDPAKVADAFPVTNTPHSVKGFRSFFGASLEKALSPYFARVVVVGPGVTPPSEPHFIADVKVDGIEARNLVTGELTYAILHMQWALAIRPSAADDYLTSFAGVARSEPSYATLDEGCQQLIKSALHDLQRIWAEKDIFPKLREAAEPKPADEASDSDE